MFLYNFPAFQRPTCLTDPFGILFFIIKYKWYEEAFHLTFLNDVIGFLGMNEEALSRLEMVTQLCMGDKVHSQLIDLMPEKCGSGASNKYFENILDEVNSPGASNFFYLIKNEVS